jgi:hypothetical protein
MILATVWPSGHWMRRRCLVSMKVSDSLAAGTPETRSPQQAGNRVALGRAQNGAGDSVERGDPTR